VYSAPLAVEDCLAKASRAGEACRSPCTTLSNCEKDARIAAQAGDLGTKGEHAMPTTIEPIAARRFDLVTEGHHFLIKLLPFREPESRYALTTFVAAIGRSHLASADVDAVLLRCLVALSEHADRRVPSLVDRYLASAATPADGLVTFCKCVEDLIRYRCVSNGSVQQAISIVSTRYAEPTCTPQFVAQSVQISLSTLCVVFKRELGRTLREHIRDVRLDRAAVLLTSTNKSIKEVWAEVGYNHPSNFDHDFKKVFHLTPREYRARALRPIAQEHYSTPASRIQTIAPAPSSTTVLIVDDDECSSETIGRFLQMEGYATSIARSGAEGLRHAERACPDVILLDYHLDDMDGLQFLRTLRQRSTSHRPAVALFTADWNLLDHADTVQSLDALIASKLCDLDQVKDLIAYLAAGSRQTRRTTDGSSGTYDKVSGSAQASLARRPLAAIG
jgi:CheY-like chemotaxis protein/AraC-like DNA-binding protein